MDRVLQPPRTQATASSPGVSISNVKRAVKLSAYYSEGHISRGVLLLSPQMEISRTASSTQWPMGIHLSYNVQSVATNHTWLPRH